MKVLVTGREGQLVRSLIERARDKVGLELITVGRPELDLENSASIERAVAAHGPNIVINAAAYTAVDQAEDEPERAFRINAQAAGEIAAAARRTGASVVQISTDYVFDGSAEGAYDEEAAVNPIGVYGRSKLEGEKQVRRENPDHAIVRTAWVYSPFSRNFLKTMVSLAASRDELTVVGDQVGSPSSALDLADGLLALLDCWRSTGSAARRGTYHLAGTGATTWAGFASRIMDECRAAGLPSAAVRPIRTEDWPTKAARPRNSVLHTDKFHRDFGYRAPAWEDGVAAVVGRLASREPA